MQKFRLLLLLCVSSWFACAEVRIENVVAEPVSPWGKVFLRYDVAGTLPEQAEKCSIYVSASNVVTHAVVEGRHVFGNSTLTLGSHAILWDLEADGLFSDSGMFVFTVGYLPAEPPPKYLIVDISGGLNVSVFPVLTNCVQDSMWTTTQIWLRRIDSGSFLRHDGKEVFVTKPYYIGQVEVTKRQYELVTGGSATPYLGDDRPVLTSTYDMIRGITQGFCL